MSETIFTVVLSGVFAIITSLIAISVDRKRAPADAAAIYQKIAADAGTQNSQLITRLDALQCQVDDLEAQLKERDRLLVEWQAGITRLIGQLESHELKPVWRPKFGPSEVKQ